MYDNRAFFLKGKENEKKFRELFDGMSESSPEDDVKRKFDMSLNLKIDFKGQRKKNRSDARFSDEFTWVELKNVQGNMGWLYGDADLFVFETSGYYIVVDKLSLQGEISKRVVKEKNEDGSPIFKKEPYRLWQRKGRKDIITMIPTVDLCAIALSMIEK